MTRGCPLRGKPSFNAVAGLTSWGRRNPLATFFFALSFLGSVFSFGAFFLSLMFRAVAFCFCSSSFVARFVRFPVGLFDLRFVFF